jgi:hypothetical protein
VSRVRVVPTVPVVAGIHLLVTPVDIDGVGPVVVVMPARRGRMLLVLVLHGCSFVARRFHGTRAAAKRGS